MPKHSGGCHCGEIKFETELDPMRSDGDGP